MWATFITYFDATDATNRFDGLWIHAVTSAAAGQALVDDSALQSELSARYGGGALRHTTSKVEIPHLANPLNSYYHHNLGGSAIMSITPINAFPVRNTAQLFHDRYQELWLLLHHLGPDYPPEDVQVLDRMLFALSGGIYAVVTNTSLSVAEKLAWFAAQAPGPSDGTQASLQLGSGSNTVTITLPASLRDGAAYISEGSAGNAWTLEVHRVASGSTAEINLGDRKIIYRTSSNNSVTFRDALVALSEFEATNVVVTGSTFGIPRPTSVGDEPEVLQFSGGTSLYSRDQPQTIAPLLAAIPTANRITAGAMFVASPGTKFQLGFQPLGTRFTLAQSFTAVNQGAPDDKPTATQLRGGEWINEVMI